LPYPGEAEAIAARPFTAGHPDGCPPVLISMAGMPVFHSPE